MRIIPNRKYENYPCSFVALGCAYEVVNNEELTVLSDKLKNNGYLSLADADKYFRQNINIAGKVYFKRTERITLKTFFNNLKSCNPTTTSKYIMCVKGHYIYVDGLDYYSFFDNDENDIICIWTILG